MTVKEQIKKLKTELAAMTWKQRFDHLWTYYKWVLGVLVGIAMIVSIVVTAVQQKQIDILFAGMSVNLDLSDEAQIYLSKDMESFLVTGEKQQVQLDMTGFGSLTDPETVEYNYNTALQVIALVSAAQLDYIMMDQTALSFYVTQAVFTDLTTVLTPEQLALFEGRIVYADPSEGEIYPIALDLRDTAFAADSQLEEIYIGFPDNTGRDYKAGQFLDYLLAWGE